MVYFEFQTDLKKP